MVFPYFLKTYHSKHHLAALRDFVSWMKLRFDYTVKIQAFLTTYGKRPWKHPAIYGIEPRAPRTTNSISNSSEDWKTPLELFTKKDQPQQHAQLKAYGCRAYAMTSNAQLGKKKRQKLDPRSHIGYLVGYNSTNIFRIWIPQRRKVISTRDVIFDEFTYFDGKFEQPTLLPSINDLIQRVEIPEDQKINQEILDEESELESVFDEDSEEEEEEQTDLTDNEEDYKRARELEEASLITPPLTEEDPEAGFLVSLPVATLRGGAV
ncbi:Integrase, catalytic core [Hirsutella rhossiliensis]